MDKDCHKHRAQDIVDQIFLQVQKYVEAAKKTNDPVQLGNIDRKKELLIQELRIVLTQVNEKK